jgi:hypothetical protein
MEIKSYFEWYHLRAIFPSSESSYSFKEESIMYTNPIKLYSGVDNPIKVRCLDSEQKRVNVSNMTIQLNIFESETNNVLATSNASSIDNANGKILSQFNSNQLEGLDFGDYEIAMTSQDINGNIYPIYMDDNYTSRLPLTLLRGPVNANSEPIDLLWTNNDNSGVTSQYVNLSDRPILSTLATACLNLNSYSGNVVAQGSIITTPSETDFANISYVNYSNTSGLVFQNVEGSYGTIRFLLDAAIGNANSYILGGNVRI